MNPHHSPLALEAGAPPATGASPLARVASTASIVPVAPNVHTVPMLLREATRADAAGIHNLIARHQKSWHLLPRSLQEITAHASRFVVADQDGAIVACGELAPLTPRVAELRSLVVAASARGAGVGRSLVDRLRRRAQARHVRTLCAFTHDPRFFVRLGFSIVPHTWVPQKISADCWSCPLFRTCGQYAMVDTRLWQTSGVATVREIPS